MIPSPGTRSAARVQGLDRVPVGRLRAALAWAHQRVGTGTFPATLLADRCQVTVEEAGSLLDVLALLGLVDRYRTPSDAWVYACGPLLAAAPTADTVLRPQETILPREMWAAMADAHARTGIASTETIAEFLDAPAGRVDRIDVAVRLATLGVRGLLAAGPDRGAAHRQWQMTAHGTSWGRELLSRGLTDSEVWTVLGADSPDVDIDLITAARRLGVGLARLEGWVDRQTRTGRFARVGSELRLTDSGREAISAVGWKGPER